MDITLEAVSSEFIHSLNRSKHHILKMTKSTENRGLDAIIIGAGPSGVAMAHSMKHKLGFEDFIVSWKWN